MTWILIILIFNTSPSGNNSPNGFSISDFTTESACFDAGNKLFQSHIQSPQRNQAAINFVCVKKGKL